ncbi:DNA ligase [Pueribacillus theae]|uniref:DNA ligase (ATP) n=1 Tax=Pueribacillus theae TaxID=2171751 RepID=A0A2U1K5L5_9BACI|nr:RNA ligase family protein [Pueribacillus theae]PWA12672.1 DNA ligase [Pueribacillus theae]
MQFQPIIPFEPIKTEDIPTGENWIFQVKWDGVRLLTYYDGKDVQLFNRKKNERTFHYPELTDIRSFCKADSVILDGEVIALGIDGKPSFHEVMRRDGIRRLERVSHLRNSVPVTYMIFDIIFYNGEWMNDFRLEERLKLLSDLIIPGNAVQLVPSFGNGQLLYQAIEQQELEGMVIKDLNSKYVINGKNASWQKKKNYNDLIAVVAGVTFRSGIVNSLLLGLYDQKGRLWYIGHAGSGKMKSTEWRQLTEKINHLKTNNNPFFNNPARIKEAVWIKPKLTVKVHFLEWTEGHELRQPVIQAFVNVPPSKCVFDEKE